MKHLPVLLIATLLSTNLASKGNLENRLPLSRVHFGASNSRKLERKTISYSREEIFAVATRFSAVSNWSSNKEFIVNGVEDSSDSDLVDGECQDLSGVCSLRAAVEKYYELSL